MVNFVFKLIIAGSLMSFILVVMMLPVQEAVDSYGADINESEITSLQKLEEFKTHADNLEERVTVDSDVDTQDSEASFFSNVFTIGKYVFSGGPISLMGSLISDMVDLLDLPPAVYLFLITIILVLATAGITKLITGR